MIWLSVVLLSVALGLGLTLWALRRKGMERWLVSYLRTTRKRGAPTPGQPVHVLLCVADHHEPKWDQPSPEVAWERVARWLREYPQQFGRFRDSDGRPPQHTFFFPLEEYEARHLDALAELCHAGFGEVEVHLHHDNDAAEGLREKLLWFKQVLSERHQLLSRDRATGEVRYGFIHGNWALDNSRPDGRWCGVNNELDVLRETGCYADFTMPSSPDPGQTRKINSIYYAWDDPKRPFSHDWGVDAGAGTGFDDALLLIQGPLLLNWSDRKWGGIPRIENGCLQANQPATLKRLELWLRARVQVPTRPDWFFVKLHTHGAPEHNARVLLGDPTARFHADLARRAQADPDFHYHYVTAREMYNLVRAAEAGWSGSVAEARDYQLAPVAPRLIPERALGPVVGSGR